MNNEELRIVLAEIAAESDGALSPDDVVSWAAHHPDHALNDEFPWDDAAAAHQYRLDIARHLIRRVHYQSRVVRRRAVVVPIYVRDPTLPANEQGYVALSSIEQRSASARVVAADELGRMVGAARRAYAVINQLGVDGLSDRLARMLAEAEAMRQLVLASDSAVDA